MPTFQAAYDTLILRKPDGSLAPMLATAWEFNGDRTELTLQLRSDVTFSDGSKFDAAAAKANLDHFRTGTGPQGGTLADVKSVEVLSEDSIKIVLSAPSPSLLIALSNAAGLMGSPKALGTEAIKASPVGSGPYTLNHSETVAGSQYTFVKRDGYWNPELQHFDKVVIKVIPDATAAVNALVSGQLDAALLNTKTAAQARQNPDLAEYRYVNNWLGLILYDRSGKILPAMKDVRVRQAINYAIDSKSILKNIYGDQGKQTAQIFGPNSSAYDETLDERYPYNPQKSRTLLAEAGYSDGFEITLPVAASLDPAMIAVVVKQLGEVGIKAKTQAADPANLIGDLTSAKYAAIPITLFQPDTWATIRTSVSPTALFNAQKTQDPKVDELMEKIRISSEDDAKKAAQELNRYLVDQAWYVPFFRLDQTFFAKKTVKVTPQQEQLVPSIYNYEPAS
ncbi:peptide/nickel transport system substrate-binding protein [Pseudarthrobacter sp. PvP004]|uniref:ABC transporter substrate-binding protein n=1 Tax=Pseudarthrobacter sp. PvP004 TaxID=2817850 RepID=UPI001AE48C27|nr:ABC transporter substrate-binding protein [Pseudarthrobacter sp. PvP004]MBP2266183.1 peptide/nickel transport system substrate-binding protein [Pseudarthrobacter sp. PvP004]